MNSNKNDNLKFWYICVDLHIIHYLSHRRGEEYFEAKIKLYSLLAFTHKS